ncbi:hypothetical protein, partial [Flavobacterium psychrophilum]|uniref:hypothetical protein n=1 Tax=Flavobacterium psychrophilum TaxID=96345 RepID=UPI001A963F82
KYTKKARRTQSLVNLVKNLVSLVFKKNYHKVHEEGTKKARRTQSLVNLVKNLVSLVFKKNYHEVHEEGTKNTKPSEPSEKLSELSV